jgi:deazaflavin-dependent oxidoreductase (nitroreductase family)
MSRLSDTFVQVMSRANIALYRSTGGRVAGRVGKAPILLLTTTGRRSGAARTTPLLFLRDGDRIAVVASYGGRPSHPSWYLNLRASPAVEVQVGRERFAATARTATLEEREQLWPRLVDMYGSYAAYERRTTREIPVVLLEPAAARRPEEDPT